MGLCGVVGGERQIRSIGHVVSISGFAEIGWERFLSGYGGERDYRSDQLVDGVGFGQVDRQQRAVIMV